MRHRYSVLAAAWLLGMKRRQFLNLTVPSAMVLNGNARSASTRPAWPGTAAGNPDGEPRRFAPPLMVSTAAAMLIPHTENAYSSFAGEVGHLKSIRELRKAHGINDPRPCLCGRAERLNQGCNRLLIADLHKMTTAPVRWADNLAGSA